MKVPERHVVSQDTKYRLEKALAEKSELKSKLAQAEAIMQKWKEIDEPDLKSTIEKLRQQLAAVKCTSDTELNKVSILREDLRKLFRLWEVEGRHYKDFHNISDRIRAILKEEQL